VRGRRRKLKDRPIIWRLVATYSKIVVNLNLFLLHNVTTWAHFFPQKNPFVPSPPFFSLARLQKFSKKKKEKKKEKALV
jgi:hypothetical protein